MLRDLAHGRIDAAYGDDPILRMILRIGPRWAVHMPGEFRAPGKEQLCLIGRKASPVLARIDGELAGAARTAIAPVLARWGLLS